MKILVTGSNGMVGSALIPLLTSQGHAVQRLTRSAKPQDGAIAWNPPEYGPHPAAVEGLDAVVHLAGETIASRWTESRKKAIRDSRVKGTRALIASLLRARTLPKVFICASAIGYYGNHENGETLREDSPPGRDFLASVCQEWEAACQPLAEKGIRVVNLRFGMILSAKGGALGKMLLPFRLGLGGKVASGRQVMSWIALDDVIGVILAALKDESFQGPVNTVAPNPVTNEEFTKKLGEALSRPAVFPLPAFAARLVFGEMADALLIGGMRVEPAKLIRKGFAFRYPELAGALQHILS